MGPGFGMLKGKIHRMNLKLEKSLSNYLGFGLFLTTVIVVVGPVSDPVNISKLVVLGTFSFGASVVFLDDKFRRNLVDSRVEYLVAIALIVSALLATIFSSQPIQRSIYGITGRNFGLITLVSYLILFLVISQITFEKNLKTIFYSFGAAGLINVIYGIISTYITDPIQWNNVYGALLGTFGNPNFAGSFYGLFSAYLTSIILDRNINKKIRLAVTTIIPLNLLCILATHTTQGLLVFALSNTITIFLYLKLEIKNKFFNYTFILISFTSAILVVAGILQKGPFQSFLYKRSVSLRGVYWEAAFKTGKEHFFTGVGLDGFGDWYRRERSLKAATWLPGPETVTNSAHNYFLDMFSFGGFPMLISYFLLIILGFKACFRIYKKISNFDFLPIALISMFFGFVAQSVISLQQIGISVWGWIFVGLLSAFAREKKEFPNRNLVRNNADYRNSLPWNTGIFLGACLGFLLSIPPYSAEASLTSAIKSREYSRIVKALQPSYFNPLNSENLNYTIVLLVNNKLSVQALDLARKAVQFNPDSFDSWKLQYYIPGASKREKDGALRNMKRLDPLNKELEKLS